MRRCCDGTFCSSRAIALLLGSGRLHVRVDGRLRWLSGARVRLSDTSAMRPAAAGPHSRYTRDSRSSGATAAVGPSSSTRVVRGSRGSFGVRARDTSQRRRGRSQSRPPPKSGGIEHAFHSPARDGFGASPGGNAQKARARVCARARAAFRMGSSAGRAHGAPRPDHPGAGGPRRRTAGRAAARADGARPLPAPGRGPRVRAARAARAGHHPQGRQTGQRTGRHRDWKGVADGLRDRFAAAARTPGARATGGHRRLAAVHGPRADRPHEPFDRFAERSVRGRSHALRDVDGWSPVHRVGSDGMGALPHRAAARATRRAEGGRPRRRLGDRPEAARQDARGALPDRCRTRARPAALPCRMGGRAPARRFPTRRRRHARPAPRPRETLRSVARGRHPACRLKPDGDEREPGAGAGFRVLGHRQVVGGQRAAQGARAPARPLRLGEVRPVQARHPVRHARTGFSGADPVASGQERGGAIPLARRAPPGAGAERTADGEPGPGARAHHRRAAPFARAPAAGRAAALPARVPAIPRRLRAAGAPAGALPRRPAVARCRDARPGRRSNDPVPTTALDADRRLPGQRGHCGTSAGAQAGSDPERGSARAGGEASAPRP